MRGGVHHDERVRAVRPREGEGAGGGCAPSRAKRGSKNIL